MRLHRLHVQGFGPFPGEEEVDFDALGRAGLFLLSGPTGSGKTSILDAVTYALYGKLLGAREGGGDPVSHHRDLDTTPGVTLELTLGASRLRVQRTPQHERPAKRGGGTTSQSPSARLEELGDGGWKTLSTRAQEVNATLEERLGMNRDQFCQVVILPQGEFATFLRAGVRDRREVLERLFPSHDFRFVENWLRDRAREAHSACEAKQAEIAEAVSGVQAVRRSNDPGDAADAADAGETGATEPPDPADRKAIEAWIESARAELDSTSRELAQQLQAVRTRYEGAAENLRKAEDRAQAVSRHEQAERSARASLGRAISDVHTFAHGELSEDVDLEDPDSSGQEMKRVREDVSGLRQFEAERLSERDELSREIERIDEKARELEGVLADADAFLQQAPKRRTDLEGWISEASVAEGKVAPARDRAADLDKRVAASRRRDELEHELQAAERLIEERRFAARNAHEYWLELREARLEGFAAELAGQLQSGERCAVCGSTEHPAPAEGGDRDVTKADEDAARSAFERTSEQHEAARKERGEIEAEHSRHDAIAGDSTTVELEAQVAGARSELEDLEKRAAEKEALATQLRELDAKCDSQQRRKDEASGELAALRERRAERRKQVESTDELEDSLRKDDASVPARRERLEQLADSLEQAGKHAADAAREARAKSVAEHTEVPVALEEAREEAASVEAERDRIVESEGNARDRLQSFIYESDKLPPLFAELEPLRERSKTVTALSDLTRGQNRRRILLSTFVLAARLEQVIEAANMRLGPMSGGRYFLVYSEDREAKNRESGLGIRVFDGHTGEERETTSLSGGETFYASLALALGLAEVVQSEIGGLRLETLFIDEGFGSLDSESLNDVMTILDELREGGRAIGVVSHVEEMRARIEAKIEVESGPNGSRLALAGVA